MNNFNSFNAPPLSAPPIGKDQFFFGRDFASFFDSLVGNADGNSTPFGGGGAGSSSNRLEHSESPDDFAHEFTNLLNLGIRSPSMNVPMSAPPVSNHSGGMAGASASYLMNNNRFMHRSSQLRINQQPDNFSLKVFLGGLPPNLTTNILQLNFAKHGASIIDWPKKKPTEDRPPLGYAFVVYESELSIVKMLRVCTHTGNRLFFPVYTLDNAIHPIELKVWEMKNTIYANKIDWRKFRRFSVFVGGITRTCTAALLTCAIEEVIGPVAYCAIELDRQHFYPKGAACVVFTTKDSYIKALAAHEVVLGFGNYERKVEFKPFLAPNMPCEKCAMTSGTRYCSEMICLAYYCHNCWKLIHNVRPSMHGHTPCKRQVKSGARP